MRAADFITERMSTGWVKSWVVRSIPKKPAGNDTVNWFGSFFKNLNKDPEFKKWAEDNITGSIVIKPKLTDDPEQSMSILDAEHVAYGEPTQHQIVTNINIAPPISDQKKIDALVNRLSARLTHELNHAHQITQRINKVGDADAYEVGGTLFKKEPPKARNQAEEYYLYMLDSLEQDAWASEIAQDIKNSLGDQSIKNLDSILKQAEKEEYAVIGSKIIQLHNLNGLFDAIKYYGKFLKIGPDRMRRQIKKEIYKYLAQ